MIVGGTGAGATATPTAQVMDFSAASPTWQPLASMPQGRHDMNLVILPDGTLLGVGGNTKGKDEQPQYDTLLYDPAMNTWRTMASQTLRRAYHSTAILLPDGRVLSGGDNRPGGGEQEARHLLAAVPVQGRRARRSRPRPRPSRKAAR